MKKLIALILVAIVMLASCSQAPKTDYDKLIVDNVHYVRTVDRNDPQYKNVNFFVDTTYVSHHQIYLPKLDLETENAKKFTKKIYNKYEKYHKQAIYHKEDRIYTIFYDHKNVEGIFGLYVTCIDAMPETGTNKNTQMYYYDVDNDKELSYKEYLNALDITENELWDWFKTTKEYKENPDNLTFTGVEGCIIDESSVVLLVNVEGEMYDNITVHIEADSVLNK